MSPSIDSKQEKAEIMLLYHSDGGLDLIAGAVLLNLGLDVLNGTSATSLFTWIPILLISSLKNRFTLPRLGFKALKTNEKIARSWTIQTAVGMAIGLLILSTLILANPFGLHDTLGVIGQGDVRNLILAVVGGLMFAASAWIIPLKRFYIYGAIMAASALINYFFLPVYLPIFLTAAVMVVIGIRLTMQFSKDYPDPEENKKEVSKGPKK